MIVKGYAMKRIKKEKKIYLIFMIFFFSLFNVMISLCDLLISYNQWDGANKFIELFGEEKEDFFQIEKYDSLEKKDFYNKNLVELTKEDIDQINSLVNSNGILVYKIKGKDKVNKDIYELLNIRNEYGDQYDAYTYQSDRVEIVDLSSDILTNQKIIGHLPEEENEIMISNYIADLIINRGIKIYSHDTLTTDYYKISNYEQLLDENTFFALNHTKVKISGIIDYDLSKYDILKNKKWDELTKEELEIGDDLIRKAKNIYNKIYVKKELIDNMKKTDPCITTGVMYPIQSKDQINSIFPKLLSNEKIFSIKTAFSEEYYHILYLNSILNPFFLVIGVISFIIFVIIVIGCIIKKKDRSIFLKDFLVFMVICSILSSMLYSLNLVVLKNVICRNYFQKLSPFQFYFKQYFILLILSIIVPMLMYSLLLLKNRFKKKSTDPF